MARRVCRMCRGDRIRPHSVSAGRREGRGVRRVELSGSSDNENEEDWTHFSKGWYADVAVRVTNMWSAVGQVAGIYKTLTEKDGAISMSRPHSVPVRHPRHGRGNPRRRPYAQIVLGRQNIKLSQGSTSFSENLIYLSGGWRREHQGSDEVAPASAPTTSAHHWQD